MILAHEYRCYPTEDEKQFIAQTSGACKVVYNIAVAANKEATAKYWAHIEAGGTKKNIPDDAKPVSWQQISNQVTQLKKTERYAFLNESPQNAQAKAIKNYGTAQTNRIDGRAKAPRFKHFDKDARQVVSFTAGGANIIYRNGKLKLPGMKDSFNIHWHRPLPADAKIKEATIKRNLIGHYYISICFETNILPEPNNTTGSIGIDLGIKDYAICSNGEVFNLPSKLNGLYKKVKKLSSKFSKAKNGSKRQKKLKQSRRKVNQKIDNIKSNALHEISNKLVKENDFIAIEDLAVKEMQGNKRFAPEIQKQSWGEFRRLLKYKAEKFGVILVPVYRYFASSQTCSSCGKINKQMKNVKERRMICSCGANHDRDVNAAINILTKGLPSI